MEDIFTCNVFLKVHSYIHVRGAKGRFTLCLISSWNMIFLFLFFSSLFFAFLWRAFTLTKMLTLGRLIKNTSNKPSQLHFSAKTRIKTRKKTRISRLGRTLRPSTVQYMFASLSNQGLQCAIFLPIPQSVHRKFVEFRRLNFRRGLIRLKCLCK